MPNPKVIVIESQDLKDSLLSAQENINPFLEYELEELLNIPVVVKDNGQEPELSEIDKIQALPSPASGNTSAETGQGPILNAASNGEEAVNQHLSQEFNFEQIYQDVKLPSINSISRDLDEYSTALPTTQTEYHESDVSSLDTITSVVTNNVTQVVICHSDITTVLDSIDPQDDQISLREAIINANMQEGTTEIHLCAGEYRLNQSGRHENNSYQGDLDIKSNLIITGEEDMTTIIDGNHLDRIFEVFPEISLTLKNITLRGGDAHSFNGGAILNSGHVILDNVNIVSNVARIGGGIFNMTGSTLDMSHTTLLLNQAELYGGGILNNSAETNMVASSLLQNSSGTYGAGITNLSGSVTINKSLFADNETGILGAGIANFLGNVLVETSTISNNMAGYVGGGIANFYGQFLQISNSTITNNDANVAGAGLYNIQPALLLSPAISSTIISENNLDMDIFGTHYQSLGYNLIGSTDGADIAPNIGDLFGTLSHLFASGLSPLMDNDGPTATHALLPGSLAIDNGNPFDTSTDQRDFIPNLTRDIGAFEFNGLNQAPQNLLQIDDIFLDLTLNTTVDLDTYFPNNQNTLASLNVDDNHLSQFFDGLPSISDQLHAIESSSELEILI
tara:strand:- start:1662 stop:3527 length:1866 start_codon:yes stop_codon:yes gene_type:complete